MENIQLGLIEDDKIIRESLESFMGAHPAIHIAVAAGSVEHFFDIVTKAVHPPQIDVLLLDIGLPGMSGLDSIKLIKQQFPDLDIVMLTTFEEDDKIFKSLISGACSYISKRTPLATIQEAIFTVHRGGSFMSPSIARKVVQHFIPKTQVRSSSLLSARQEEIVQGLVDGLSYKLIADKLDISIDTVRDHIKRIYRTLEVNSKAEIIRKALDKDF